MTGRPTYGHGDDVHARVSPQAAREVRADRRHGVGRDSAADQLAPPAAPDGVVEPPHRGLAPLGRRDVPADPADGRAQVLTPSAEGAARLARIRDARRARWEADLADWSAHDVERLGELLGRLNRIGEARDA